jgi:hypothetical protein
MAQVSLDDKRKHKEAGDFFMTGKTHFRNKDMHAAVAPQPTPQPRSHDQAVGGRRRIWAG